MAARGQLHASPHDSVLSKVVAEDVQRVSMAPTMAAEVAEDKLARPEKPGLGFYKEEAECLSLLVRSHSRMLGGEGHRR